MMSPFTVPSSVNTRVGPVASAGANGCVEEFTPCRTTRDICAVLPEIVEAVKGRAKVVVDGSFSRGSDIVKAICLGADWVGLGRLYCYGLAANGAAGIERVVELLEEEMKEVMGLLGVTSLKQLDRSYITRSAPTNWGSVHSAFPLMREGY